MNKKANTLLFILGATAFNIIIAIASFFAFFVLYANFLLEHTKEAAPWILFGIFIAALAVSFVVYRVVLKFLLKKIDVDKYFDPLFVRRNIKKTG